MCLYSLSVFVSFKLFYTYLSRMCEGVFVFVCGKKQFLVQTVQVAFGYSQWFLWQKSMVVFLTLVCIILVYTVLRTDLNEPSCFFA